MERNQELTGDLIEYSEKITLDIIGFADPNLFLRYSEENRPTRYLDDCRTVIIVGFHIYDLILDAWSHRDGKGTWGYQFVDGVIEQLCNRIRRYLQKKKYKSVVIPYQPGLFLKEAAALAGIGPIGKNNLLMTEGFGSQVRLRAIATNAPLLYGEPKTKSPNCENCTICMDACPANAFPEEKYSRELCIKYMLTHQKQLSNNTAIDCNVCIESCPVTRGKRNPTQY